MPGVGWRRRRGRRHRRPRVHRLVDRLLLTDTHPNLGIGILEQNICGGGPSGRNGGFASGWWDELDSLVHLYGAEAAVRTCRAISRSIDSIGEFCAAHNVDAWFKKDGYMYVATARPHLAACEHMG